MRGQTLANLLRMLKAELRVSLDASVTANDDLYAQLLNNKQKWFAATYDWPFLASRWSLTVAERYVSVPTVDARGLTASINFERPIQVFVETNEYLERLDVGVGQEEQNIYADTDTASPIMRYQLVMNGTQEQFEFWPTPSETQTVVVLGQRQINEISTNVVADLDDLMLVLHVAAEDLAARGSKDAQAKAVLAQQRFITVRQNYPAYSRRLVLGCDTDTQLDGTIAKIVD